MLVQRRSVFAGLGRPAPLLIAGLLSAVSAGCIKADEGADTAGIKKRKPAPTPVPTKGTPVPEFSACEARCNVYTQVDGWQLRFAPTWGTNVLVTLLDVNNPASLVFTHPTRELAFKGLATEGSCVESPAASILEASYPVVDGLNLFGAKGGAGGEPYRYVFTVTDRRYVAVARGADGCSAANRAKPGSCYVFGAVDGNRVVPVNNACVGGYAIQNRVGGIPVKADCRTGAPVPVQGQAFPAAFLLIHDYPGYAKPGECETPTRPPTDPTPIVTVTPIPGSTPVPGTTPVPGLTPVPGTSPTPGYPVVTVTPQQPGKPGNPPVVITPIAVGTPSKNGTPPTGEPKVPTQPTQPPLPCDPWSKNGCADGWSTPGAPKTVTPPVGTPVPGTDPTPVQTHPSSPIWYKK